MIDPDLREFVRNQSPQAFRALVDHYASAVHAQCIRQLRDRHLADDVTQAVFMALARKARSLPENVILPAWLFKATRFACANTNRDQLRRKRHEHEAAIMREQLHEQTGDSRGGEIEPVLDDALARLGRLDREMIVLRYYTGLNAAEVGQSLGLSHETARRRISRAVQKLRDMLNRRGVDLASTVLLTHLEDLHLHSVTQSLSEQIVASALNPAAASPWCAAATKGVLHMMKWSQIKLATAAALLILTGVSGIGTMRMALAQTPAAAQPAEIAPTTQDQTMDRALIRSSIENLAKAIRANDLAAFNQCTSFSNDDDGAMNKAMLLENIAYRHLQNSWAAKFNSGVRINGFGFVWFPQSDGGFEVMLEEIAKNLVDSDIQVNGNVARLRLSGGTFEKGQELAGWRGRWLCFVNDGVSWKFDINKFIRVNVNMVFRAGKIPASSDQEMQIAIGHKQDVARILESVAQATDTGVITSAAEAANRVEKDLKQMQAKYGLAGIGYTFALARPVSGEVGD